MAMSTQAAYGIICKAARNGQAKAYFEEVYKGMVPRAKMENTKDFMEYIDRRKEMYLHYGWEDDHAQTSAVLDGIEALVRAIADERVLRVSSN